MKSIVYTIHSSSDCVGCAFVLCYPVCLFLSLPIRTNLHGEVPNLWQSLQENHGDLSVYDKLRWSSLGYHYDWTNREYRADFKTPFPQPLAQLSQDLAALAGYPKLKAEAALVNYYTSSSIMGAHVDDAELTKLHPIISLSLGLSGKPSSRGSFLSNACNQYHCHHHHHAES